jgi:ABC-type nitrate/sulfonate/bicarbonate transport system ATPase subunit
LLHIIAGLDIPTAGTLTLDGEPISKPGFERGLVFQDPNLFPWLSVRKNIEVGLLARKVLKEKRHEVADYIRLVGLQGFEKSFPHKLSGGMAQRVAIARALINHPKVLLMDEPLGALDAFTRMMLQDELLNIWAERQITAVLVTHDIDEAIYMSDRIVIMTPRPGKVQEVIRVNFSRPRRRNDPELFALKSRILDILHFTRAETPLGYYL